MNNGIIFGLSMFCSGILSINPTYAQCVNTKLEKIGYNLKQNQAQITLEDAIEQFDKLNLEFKPKFKKYFEDSTQISITGEYNYNDVKNLEKIMENYGVEWLIKKPLKKIIFIPESTLITRKGLNPNSHIIGIASPIDNLLVIKTNLPNKNYHEFAHFHHYTIDKNNPEFKIKWDKINGGYIDNYQHTNWCEDVAVLSEKIIGDNFNFEKPNLLKIAYKLQTIDDKTENILEKVRLLYDYGFFPKKFTYGNLNNK